MRHLASLPLLLAAPLLAQTGAIAGLDLHVFDVDPPFVYARRGAAFPGGEVSFAIGHWHCNGGTVHIPWLGVTPNYVMLDTYPKITYLLARESGGRFEQVSTKAFAKHSVDAFNFNIAGPCGVCQYAPTAEFRIGCVDVYSGIFNGFQDSLGPTDEIDPWLGSWNPVGSYFDRGDPDVGGAAAVDGINSLDTTSWDAFKNRMLAREADLLVPGAQFFGQSHCVVKQEPGTNRGNNVASRAMTFTWNGTQWTCGNTPAPPVVGTVLQRWSGASIGTARNGLDDGHFHVAAKVTGPDAGLWHYEYVVHNQDNARGGAAFRLPICPTARVLNPGFRDIDSDPLNDWTVSIGNGEIAFLATANNPHDWNSLFNFRFDSDAAPIPGNATIDQARIGPGALSVTVATTVPGLLGNVFLGAGCGTPTPALSGNGTPASPNPGYALQAQLAANALGVLAFAAAPASNPLGGGCTQFVDGNALLTTVVVQANGSGLATWAMPIPPALLATDVAVQLYALQTNGPILGFLAASNGVLIRGAGIGCP